MEIRRCVSVDDCFLCDEFLKKLNKYESMFDDLLNESCDFKNMHKNSLNKDGVYIAIAYENKPVGYVFAYLKSVAGKVHKTNIINIDSLFVDEECRNKGIGKKLIDSVDYWAKESYKDYALELHAIDSNVKSINFYKTLGFKEVRTVFRR